MTGNSTVAAVLGQDLAALGARRCFALLGTANFKISHALAEAGVELIAARHEGNAASMADAYAKATGELTLVSVHSGPGLTNAITGIGEAAKSRTPLVVLAGDVPAGAVKNNFYIEQAEHWDQYDALMPRLIATWPEDYVYPFRFGRSQLERERSSEALPYLERAAARAYGENRLRVAQQRVRALKRLGRREDARRVAAEALKANGPWFPELVAALKAEL